MVREVWVGEGWGGVGGLVGTLWMAIRRVGVLVRSGLAGWGRITYVVPGKRLLVGIPWGTSTRVFLLSTQTRRCALIAQSNRTC